VTTPAEPVALVRVYHDEIYSLVTDEDPNNEQSTDEQAVVAGEVYDSLGEYRVQSALTGEDEVRKKIRQTVPGGYTEVGISPDFTGTPTEFTHLAEMLLDRHAPGEHVTGLYCLAGDKKIAKRLAALMDVEYLTTEPEAPAPAQEG
jgi:hypothetical protein